MDGSSLDKEVPVHWDSTKIDWKVPVPGEGYSSPIIWGDRIFLTTAYPERLERALLCFDRMSGKLLWERTVLKSPLEPMHPDNGYASSTPVTDGERIYVSFQDSGMNFLAAYDFNGNLQWKVRPGIFKHEHGYCSSLAFYNGKVILHSGSRGDLAFAAAFDCRTGREVWRINHIRGDGSYAVPFIREMAGCTQMILCADGAVASHDPESGEKLWEVDTREDEYQTTPVFHDEAGLLLTCTSYDRRYIRAIRPACKQEEPDSMVRWGSLKGGFYVACPVAIDEYFLTVQYGGYTYCFLAASGEILWRQKTGKQYSSPVTAGGLVYSVNDYGLIRVIKPGPVFETLFEYDFHEKIWASPAISQGHLYIRSIDYLYCIGE